MKTTSILLFLFACSLHAEPLDVWFGTGSSKGIHFATFDPDKGKLSAPRVVAEVISSFRPSGAVNGEGRNEEILIVFTLGRTV